MNNFNMIARLTRDPEQNGNGPVKFGVAYNEKYGENESVSYFDVNVWGKGGDVILKYVSKGDMLGMSGNLRQDSWEDKDGNKRSNVVLNCRDFTLIGGNKNSEGKSGSKKSTRQAEVDNPDFPEDEVPF